MRSQSPSIVEFEVEEKEPILIEDLCSQRKLFSPPNSSLRALSRASDEQLTGEMRPSKVHLVGKRALCKRRALLSRRPSDFSEYKVAGSGPSCMDVHSPIDGAPGLQASTPKAYE